MKLHPVSLAIAASLLTSTSIWAETDTRREVESLTITGTKERGYTAPESVSATRSYVPIMDTPRSVQVLSQEFIQDANIDRLEDALMYVPGVERANDLGQLEHSLTIRGFSADGMVFRNGKRSKYGGQIDMNLVERVEVLKGPASVQFGYNSPGGIVNVITKKPQAQTNRDFKVRLDEHGKREFVADFTGATSASGNTMYRLIATGEDSDTYRDFSEVKAATIAPSLRFLFNDDTMLDVGYQYQYSKRAINQGLPQDNFTDAGQLPEELVSANFGEPGDDGEYNNHWFDLSLQHQINDRLKAELSYVYAKRVKNTRSTGPSNYLTQDTVVDGQTLAKGSIERWRFGNRDDTTKSHQASALMHVDLDIGPTNHLMTFGIDYSSSEKNGNFLEGPYHDHNLGIPVFNVFNRVYGQYDPQMKLADTDERKSSEIGVFISETAYLTDELIVNLGVRYDSVKSERKVVYTSDRPDRVSDNSESDYTWNVGALYKLIPELSLYSSYATSFEPNYNKPDVGEHKNMRGKQWELGVKGDVNGELLYSLVYYDLTKENIAKTLPDDTTRLVGEQKSNGVEVELNYNVAEDWALMASYAYTNAKYTRDPEEPELEGNKVAGVAPHSAALFTNYSLDKTIPGLSVIGGIKYRGKAPFNDANTFDTNAFTTIDLGVKYRLALAEDDALNLQAGVQNLTDEAGIWTDTWSVNYSKPRTFYVNADYAF